MLTTYIASALRRFRRDQAGWMTIEAVLVLPFLTWGAFGLYGYWDAYRSMTAFQKSAYTMSDLISREQRPITAAYIAGMQDVMSRMTGEEVQLRVTSVMWDQLENRYEVEWSNSPSGWAPLTTASVALLTDRIPEMTDGRTAIIFEANVDYEPSLSVRFRSLTGIGPTTFEEFIVTPPRYAPRVVLRN